VGAGPGTYWNGFVRNADGALVLERGKPFEAGSPKLFKTLKSV
jgi:hypothetical protein